MNKQANTQDNTRIFPIVIPTGRWSVTGGRGNKQYNAVPDDQNIDAEQSCVLIAAHGGETLVTLNEIIGTTDKGEHVWSFTTDNEAMTPEVRAENRARKAEAMATYARSKRGIETERKIAANIAKKLAAALESEGMTATDAAAMVEQVQTAADAMPDKQASTLADGLAALLASVAAPAASKASKATERKATTDAAAKLSAGIRGTCEVCNHPTPRNLTEHPATTNNVLSCTRCLKLDGKTADARAARFGN